MNQPSTPKCPINEAVEDFISGYEVDSGEGIYTPTEHDRFLLTDAINSLLNDDDSMEIIIPAILAQRAPAAPVAPHQHRYITHPDGSQACEFCSAAPVVAEGLQRYVSSSYAGQGSMFPNDKGEWFRRTDVLKLLAAHPVAGSPADCSVCSGFGSYGDGRDARTCNACNGTGKAAAEPMPASEAASVDLNPTGMGCADLDDNSGPWDLELAAPAAPTDAKPDDRRAFLAAWLGDENYNEPWPDHFSHAFTGWMAAKRTAQSARDAAQPTIAVEERLQNVWNDALEEAALLVETNDMNSAAFNADEIRALKGRAIASTTTTKG